MVARLCWDLKLVLEGTWKELLVILFCWCPLLEKSGCCSTQKLPGEDPSTHRALLMSIQSIFFYFHRGRSLTWSPLMSVSQDAGVALAQITFSLAHSHHFVPLLMWARFMLTLLLATPLPPCHVSLYLALRYTGFYTDFPQTSQFVLRVEESLKLL